MQESLVKLSSRQLHSAEVEQIIARFIHDVETSRVKQTDEEFKRLLTRLKSKLTAHQTLEVPEKRNDQNTRLREADHVRDSDIRALTTAVRAYRSSRRDNERQAYLALSTLFKSYHNLTDSNYEEETAMIKKLLTKLKSEPYQAHVTTLSLTNLVRNLTDSQTQFEAIFDARSQKRLTQATARQVKDSRTALYREYENFCCYIAAMHWAKGTEFYEKILAIINNGRRDYAGTIAKRDGRTKKRKKQSETTLTPSVSEETTEPTPTAPEEQPPTSDPT